MCFSDKKQTGFTIVELMIATSIFSVILLVSLAAFIQINRLYTKGLTVAKTQDAVRNVVTDISNQIQYSSISPFPLPTDASGRDSVCIGTKKYTYKPNVPEDLSGSALTSEDITDTANCVGLSNKKVLLPKNTRVLNFEVSPLVSGAPIYKITVTLLNAPDDNNPDYLAGTDLVDTTGGIANMSNWRCEGGVKGGEYCSLATITTSVLKRI